MARMGMGRWAAMAVFVMVGVSWGQVPAGDLGEVVRDLASNDFTIRQAAQKRLDQVGLAQREDLETRAKAASDPEVKARLLARIETIDTEEMLKPRLVSLDLKNATLADCAAAMTKAMGYPVFGAPPLNGGTGPLVTLQVKDVTWSEAVRQIAEKSPLSYTPSVVGVSFANVTRALAPLQTAGPILFLPNPSAVVATEGVWVMGSMYVDPRMQVLGQQYRVTEAKDEQGRKVDVLLSEESGYGGSGPVGPMDHVRVNHKAWRFVVAPPAGAKSVTLKGEAELQVVVKYETRELRSPAEEVGKAMKVGGRELTIVEFGEDGGFEKFRVNADTTPTGAPVAGNVNAGQLRYVVKDADGAVVAVLEGTFVSPRNIPLKGARLPVRMDVMAPVATKAMKVPFEWKGLSLQAAEPLAAGMRGARGGN